MPCYERVGPGLTPSLDGRHPPLPVINHPFQADQLTGSWGHLGKVNCGGPGVTLALCLGVHNTHPLKAQGAMTRGWSTLLMSPS